METAALESYAANLFGPMLCNVMFGRFIRMVIGMQIVAVGNVGMMCRLFVAAGGIMLGSLLVMSGRMFVMLCCFSVVFCALLAHRAYRGFGLTAGGTIPPAENDYHDRIDRSNTMIGQGTGRRVGHLNILLRLHMLSSPPRRRGKGYDPAIFCKCKKLVDLFRISVRCFCSSSGRIIRSAGKQKQ
jgi:hypothetical protein